MSVCLFVRSSVCLSVYLPHPNCLPLISPWNDCMMVNKMTKKFKLKKKLFQVHLNKDEFLYVYEAYLIETICCAISVFEIINTNASSLNRKCPLYEQMPLIIVRHFFAWTKITGQETLNFVLLGKSKCLWTFQTLRLTKFFWTSRWGEKKEIKRFPLKSVLSSLLHIQSISKRFIIKTIFKYIKSQIRRKDPAVNWEMCYR